MGGKAMGHLLGAQQTVRPIHLLSVTSDDYNSTVSALMPQKELAEHHDVSAIL